MIQGNGMPSWQEQIDCGFRNADCGFVNSDQRSVVISQLSLAVLRELRELRGLIRPFGQDESPLA